MTRGYVQEKTTNHPSDGYKVPRKKMTNHSEGDYSVPGETINHP